MRDRAQTDVRENCLSDKDIITRKTLKNQGFCAILIFDYYIDSIDYLIVIEESVRSNEAVARIDGVAEYMEQAFQKLGGSWRTL